jgi:glycerol kinase
MPADHVLVLDEGTSSTRAMVLDRAMKTRAMAQAEIALDLPLPDRVEQDAAQIWTQTLTVARAAIAEVGGADRIAAIAITNQRETSLVWDAASHAPFGPAIVWQDRRTAKACEALKAEGHEPDVQARTGLLLDPYFSATKLQWILANRPGAAEAARAGRARFGTVDSWLIWNLTRGRVHATDVTNASRTLLMDIKTGEWDAGMLALFGVDRSLLPDIRPSAALFGETHADWFGRPIPILSVIGDQQGALVGQGCFQPGEAKATYGTGAFLVVNTGRAVPVSSHRLLATVGYQAGPDKAFALEGSIFNAGTVTKWLRDDLGLIASAAESEAMARSVPDTGGVYLVPAFTGLGAPHWDPDARGAITGITRATRAAHIVRAGVEAAAYQTADLLGAFAADGAGVQVLRVDGGMAANRWFLQFLADICNVTVEVPQEAEMTAIGAGVLAGVELGWLTLTDWSDQRVVAERFTPSLSDAKRSALMAGWTRALNTTLTV